jgi:SHS2 domain-containing protein
MVSLMWDPDEIIPAAKVEVTVSGMDLKQLLLVFLEELLFLLDTRNFLLHSAEKVIIRKTGQEYILQAVFWGDENAADTEIFGSVKAVTYHDMQVRAGDRPMVQVVVDM